MHEKTGVMELRYLDPIGAILISIYIMVNWWKTGKGKLPVVRLIISQMRTHRKIYDKVKKQKQKRAS